MSGTQASLELVESGKDRIGEILAAPDESVNGI